MEKIWLKSYPPGVRAEIDLNEYPSLEEIIDAQLRAVCRARRRTCRWARP